jgi:ribosomal protein S18 acetylase RimI-like enzyme
VTIRPARVEDVEQVVLLVAKIAAFHEQRDPARYCFRPNVAQSYRGWLTARATDEQSVFLVAEREASAAQAGKLVGFLVADSERDIPIYRVDRIGFVHDLWVDEDYRNEGIARQLVTLALERFREIGVQQVRLDVLVDNAPARKLFESCGFRASTIMMLHTME